MQKAVFYVSYYASSPDCLHGRQRSWLLSPKKLGKDYVKLFSLCFHYFTPVITGCDTCPIIPSAWELFTGSTKCCGRIIQAMLYQWKLSHGNQKKLQHLRKKEYSGCYPSTLFSIAPRQIAPWNMLFPCVLVWVVPFKALYDIALKREPK